MSRAPVADLNLNPEEPGRFNRVDYFDLFGSPAQ